MATPSEKHEIHCAKRYLEYTETPFYRAFRDRENPESFDSNYAVLKRMEEAEQSLAAVESYYEGLDVTPKFYSKPDSVTLEESRAFFEAHGYAVHTFECQRMMLLTHTSPELLVHKCPVQIFAGAPLTGAAAQLVIVSFIGASADSTQTLYTREGYLTCNILCTPTLKQSVKVDLEGSTTSSFYGLKATVGYQNRNIFRGAESFDLSFTAGYEFMKAPDARRKRATEFGVTTGLTFPRFLVPWRTGRFRTVNQPKTKVELSINFQDRPYYARTLSSAGITYMWTNSRYSSFSLRPIDINVVDMTRPVDPEFLGNTSNKYLINSFKTQFIGGLSFGYGYNNQRKNLGGNATNIRFNAETAGNLIDAVEHAFFSPAKGKEQYTIFGIEYSQYFRTDLSVSRKIMLGGATALVGRLYGGVAMAYGNSSSVPFDRQFYCGGSNGMRGWTPRTLGQGSVANPHNDFPVQTGDVKLEANLELRFPVWGMIHGATFFDLGNIWYIRHYSGESEDTVFRFDRFYKQLGFNTGLGLRFDIKFAVLRLDWGIQLHNPNNPSGERWIHNFKWKNTALNFGVGYPF